MAKFEKTYTISPTEATRAAKAMTDYWTQPGGQRPAPWSLKIEFPFETAKLHVVVGIHARKKGAFFVHFNDKDGDCLEALATEGLVGKYRCAFNEDEYELVIGAATTTTGRRKPTGAALPKRAETPVPKTKPPAPAKKPTVFEPKERARRVAKYLISGGTHCPACESPKVVLGGPPPLMAGTGGVQRRMACDACGAAWTDQLSLSAVLDLTVPVKPS